MNVIKPLSNAVSLASANNVSAGQLIYIMNSNTSAANILFSYANSVQYASLNLCQNTNIIVQKASTDLLTAISGCVATSIAWPKG